MDNTQADKMRQGAGFVAALDQSGGSTPKALRAYGVSEDAYGNDDEMFDRIHEMRTRIVQSPDFTGDKVIGAILFENTMNREIGGVPSARYLWDTRGVVPFLKVDKGLHDEEDGVQMMKDMGDLDARLQHAKDKGIFGTKMRSVINGANEAGIRANVAQQFQIGRQIAGHDMMPILEPEVSIDAPDKAEAEAILRDAIAEEIDKLPDDVRVMLKLTLPSEDGFYRAQIEHPKVMRVVALSGGYSRQEANDLLARNRGMIASFSRALAEGLSADQSDAEFDGQLSRTIDSIYDASRAGG